MDKDYKSINDQYVLSAVDGKTIMDQDKHVILIDVRTEDEYLNQHIQNSKLLPVDQMFYFVEHFFPDKNLTYIIYCRSGVRSAYARKVMKHLGYHHVYDMGGIIDWPYETIR